MWKRYRTAVAILEATVILSLPFLKVNGQSALRFDIPTLTLYFFGTPIRITEFYFVLLVALFLFVLISWLTTVFGRLWCGWLCPQTVLLDIAEDIGKRFSKRADWLKRLVLIPLSALVSASLMWYFITPQDFFVKLFHSRVITGFFIVTFIVIYLELAFVGRKFCKYICPYSMLQNALFDRDTLVIRFQPRPSDFHNKKPCLMCRQCEVVCPVEIDIKKGVQRQCIACAACIDACKEITSKKSIKEFIGYTGKILRPKTFILAAVTAIFALSVVLSVISTPPFTVVIKRDPNQPSSLVNYYTYTITNNLNMPLEITFTVKGPYEFIGQKQIVIKPFQVFTSHFMLRAKQDVNEPAIIKISSKDYIVKERVGYL